jgi:CHASE3 domain sensor protein
MKRFALSNHPIRLAFGSAIVMLLVVGAFSYRSIVISNESDRWVRHTHEVLENLQDLHLAMAQVESSARGFVLTGSDSYIDSYQAGVSRVKRDRAVIGDLTADNPIQQRRLPGLEAASTRKIELADKILDLSQPFEAEAASSSWMSLRPRLAKCVPKSCDYWRRARRMPRGP